MIFILACFFVAMILFLLLQYAVLIIKGESLSYVISNFIHHGFRTWYRSVVSGLSGGAVIFVILLWQASLQREQKLREENLIFQNQTLKAQVNPHFLFNCLNTLSSLIVTNPDTAERFIGRLSQIYRYITENSTRDKVSLERELDFIHDYFFLHKIRDADKIILEESVSGSEKYEILPVSLQVLVENAIKHNMATREQPLVIKIYLEDGMIVVKNNLQKMSGTLKSTGTGLKNLSERIRLLTGKEILVNESQNEFTVKLPLLS
jgi:LytS/YehU family sensor histidine kinase